MDNLNRTDSMTSPTSQPSPLPWMIAAAKQVNLIHSNGYWSRTKNPDTVVAEEIARRAPTDSREKRLEAALEQIDRLAKKVGLSKSDAFTGRDWLAYGFHQGWIAAKRKARK